MTARSSHFSWGLSRVLLLFCISMALLTFGLGGGCQQHTDLPPPVTPSFDKERAWADLLKQVGFGPRVPGTDAHQKCQDYLYTELQRFATNVTLQPFSHVLGSANRDMNNIIGTCPGTGVGTKENVVLLAHWDTRPTSDREKTPELQMTPFDGANDGASGVAVLMEIARQLKEHPISRTVTILLVDGEDYGDFSPGHSQDGDTDMLLGSDYYAAHLPDPKPNWGILLDMVGDADLDIYREPYSEANAKAVNDRVFSSARTLGYLRTAGMSGFVDQPFKFEVEDDHYAFIKAGVPTADLIDFEYGGTDNPYWHTQQDTSDHCSADSLEIVGCTVLYALQL